MGLCMRYSVVLFGVRKRGTFTYHCKSEEYLERRNPGDGTGGILPKQVRLVITLEDTNTYRFTKVSYDSRWFGGLWIRTVQPSQSTK